MIKYFTALFLFIVGFIYISSCSDPIIAPKSNLPPNTYLSVFSMPGDTVAPGKTVKKISWWGDSPAGIVVGFKISFDSINWSYTTQNDSTFAFSIAGQDSLFRIWVAAVDDKGNIDPTPASNLYPVINSAPSMVFDPSVVLPDTIFPVATLKWIGTDPDGDATIANYWYSINDTLHFKSLPGNLNIMTLTKDSGLVAGNTCVYMKAQDNAHAFSNIVRMPQDSSKFFRVRNVTSKILLIKDMPAGEFGTAESYFGQVMDTIHYDVLDIKSNNGNLIPKIINPMFVETLKLYSIVMWVGNRNGGGNSSNDPNLNLAQNSLPYYINSGGKVLWSSGFPNISIVQGALFNFAPIDSIKTTCFVPLILGSDTTFLVPDNSYPRLLIDNSAIIAGTKGFYSFPSAKTIYRILPRGSCTNDTISIGVKNSTNNPNIIFLLFPLYIMNRDMNASKLFMRQALITDFGYGTTGDKARRNRRLF
ncbi:MAG: hypothetical protein PHN88_07065 [Ignavibacteria bacterium]|nr:hypothetical protein [Ignavibacteria bacterium]